MQNSIQQPKAIDLEQFVLGAAIGYNGSGELIEILRKEKVFYKPEHQEIYDAVVSLYERSENIDLLSVSHELKRKNKLEAVGGQFELIELTQKITGTAKLNYHARIIQQMFVKRQAISVGNNITDEAYKDETDIFELLEASYRELDKVSDWLMVKKSSELKDIVDKIFDAADKQTVGVPSSLQKLQSKLNGYQNTDLIILAARPGMGKTALMINEAMEPAKQGIPVGIFSLEMSDKQLTGRMLANYCGINVEKISLNTLSESEIRLMNEKRHEFSKLPIYIHDQPAMSPLEIKIQAAKWKREKGVKMIFVDYLQLMRLKSNRGNREQEVSECSAALKGLAKELDIPVMALSQLSRSVETRGGSKRPMLSDLRESGAIEQDADIIMFLLRLEYYKIEEWDDDERTPTAGTAEINIAKFRNGKTGACLVGSKLEFMQFHDLEESWQKIASNIDNEFNPPAPPLGSLEDAFDGPVKSNPEDEEDMPF